MILRFVDLVFRFLEIAIILEVILSWVPTRRYNPYVEKLHKITSPLLEPGRQIQYRFFPRFMLDVSPLIALFILSVLRNAVFRILYLLMIG